MTYHIGITGTRKGMTSIQERLLATFLTAAHIGEGQEFHHGDCIGVDIIAAGVAKSIGYVIVGHPPTNRLLRAYYHNHVTMPTEDYLDRNHSIVEAIDLLIVIPKQDKEVMRSGTWATYRYAKKNDVLVTVIYPQYNPCGKDARYV